MEKIATSRINSLDGLRAFAVVLVLLYHLQVPGFEGGFVGVEIFFVLSGFLITWLLMRSAQRVSNGEATLREVWLDFFIRRGRRLLPPLAIMLIVVTVVWMIFRPAQYTLVRLDGLAALLNMQNWWFIFHKVSYADNAAGQSPLLHLWSLSIEEQFYIFWPIILFGVVIGLRSAGRQRWNRRILVVVLLIACLASGYLLYQLGHSAADPSEAYFNTFARASALLSGAALALARMNRSHAGRGGGAQGLGWLLLLGLIACTVFLRENESLTYSGGLFFVDLATVLLIATLVARPTGEVSRMFGHPIGAWIGSRSYAIYIWHWPLIIWFDQNNATGFDKVLLGALVLGLSLAFAEMSWWLVERPSRWFGRKMFIGFSIVVGAVAVFALLVPIIRPYTPPTYLTNAPVHFVAPTSSAASPEPTVVDGSSGTDTASSEPTSTPSESPRPTPIIRTPSDCGVSLVGDSVLLGARNSVTSIVPNIRSFDAQVSLQFDPGMEMIERHFSDDSLGCVVVIALGTNGSYSTQSILNFSSKLPSTSRMVLVNTQSPRNWVDRVNQEISQAQQAQPQKIAIFNWQSYALAHPEVLATDRTHLGSVASEDEYAQQLLAAIERTGAGRPVGQPAPAGGK